MTIWNLIKHCRKLSKRLENTAGKEEIAECSKRAISPFPIVFSRRVPQIHKNQGLFGKGLKHLFLLYLFSCGTLGKKVVYMHTRDMSTL